MSVYMPLDCDGFAAVLADYLEGDAPDAVRAAVEAHAEECAACGALLADLQDIPVQAAGQSIPAGLLVTLPGPLTVTETGRSAAR